MEQISINGGTELIFDVDDIEFLVTKYGGYDLGQLVKARIQDIDTKKLYTQEMVKTDVIDMEGELDNIHSIINEALDIIEGLEECIRAKRINKGKLSAIVDSLKTVLATTQ